MTPVRVPADRVRFIGSQLRFWRTRMQVQRLWYSLRAWRLRDSAEKSPNHVPVVRNRPLYKSRRKPHFSAQAQCFIPRT